MIKKVLFYVFLAVDIILGILFIKNIVGASRELVWVNSEKDSIQTSGVLEYLDWEDYGTAGVLARSYRVGAKVREDDENIYRLGEYADLLFLSRIHEEDPDDDTAGKIKDRMDSIRAKMSDYAPVFDEMDLSLENTLKEREK